MGEILNIEYDNTKLFHVLKRILSHLSGSKTRKIKWILLLSIINSLTDVISIGALLPFLALLTSPEKVLSYEIISDIAGYFEIYSSSELLFPVTLFFVFAVLLSGVCKVLMLIVGTRFAFSIGSELSIKAYSRTLNQPYLVHVGRNSSEVVSIIVTKVEDVVFRSIQPILQLITSTILVFVVSIFLIYLNPIIAITAFGSIATMYFIVSMFFYKKLEVDSENISRKKDSLVKIVNEGLGGIQDVLLGKTQPFYSKLFSEVDVSMRRSQGSVIILSNIPRYIIESIGIIIITVIAYGYSRGEDALLLIPLLGAMALGAQRLLPAIQQIFGSWATITGNFVPLQDVLRLLEQNQIERSNEKQGYLSKLNFDNFISLRSISFSYGKTSKPNLNEISLTIRKGSCVGLVGSTGSGKSTLVDIIIGLLRADTGIQSIDGVSLDTDEKLVAWQKNISHVPQKIFLSDSTIAENIAFGKEVCDIDYELVRQAATNAEISGFIESLPQKYSTRVGENGVQLSGGQHQRIGIARALYKRTSVLVFDEATSALDSKTEKAIIERIRKMKSVTIIMVAHRIQTIMECDIIFELDSGVLVNQGTYEELVRDSATFKQLSQGVAS